MKIVEPKLRMKLNDACLLALGYKPEQCRFAMAYTEVTEGTVRLLRTRFNFDSDACSARVQRKLAITYRNGEATFKQGQYLLKVRGNSKFHAIAVCAALTQYGIYPETLLEASVKWQLNQVW